MGWSRKKIIITSGPTRMPLDGMRFLSNRSTGKFGALLAEEALRRGANVTFIQGEGSEVPKAHRRLKCLPVETNRNVAAALRAELKRGHCDVCIHAMAVLDFQPSKIRKGKTKTKNGIWNLRLVPTPKIINQIKKWDPKIFLVGFKLEMGVSRKVLLKRAKRLLRQSGADLVLANQLTEGEDPSHEGLLLNTTGKIVCQAKGKKKLSKMILNVLDVLCRERESNPHALADTRF